MQTKQMVWQMQKNKELPPQTRRFIERADLWDPCCAKAIGQLYRKYVTQDYMRKDGKRVAVLLQKTHGGQDLTTAEYNIVMAYWRGQKSQKELFDRVFERVVG